MLPNADGRACNSRRVVGVAYEEDWRCIIRKQHWQDCINALLGLWVFTSPWVLQHPMISEAARDNAGDLAMWNLWIVGVAVAFLAIVALALFNPWEEWLNLVLGVWLLVSPWLLGFSASAALLWNAVIVGTLIVVFAGWTLIEEKSPKRLAG